MQLQSYEVCKTNQYLLRNIWIKGYKRRRTNPLQKNILNIGSTDLSVIFNFFL